MRSSQFTRSHAFWKAPVPYEKYQNHFRRVNWFRYTVWPWLRKWAGLYLRTFSVILLEDVLDLSQDLPVKLHTHIGLDVTIISISKRPDLMKGLICTCVHAYHECQHKYLLKDCLLWIDEARAKENTYGCRCNERLKAKTPMFVYYEGRKWELNKILIYECRCNERLSSKS